LPWPGGGGRPTLRGKEVVVDFRPRASFLAAADLARALTLRDRPLPDRRDPSSIVFLRII
jgi:hypothetical protein